MDRLGYDPATVVFLITRVGTSQDAIEYVEELSSTIKLDLWFMSLGKILRRSAALFRDLMVMLVILL